jgi:hypothetical protein
MTCIGGDRVLAVVYKKAVAYRIGGVMMYRKRRNAYCAYLEIFISRNTPFQIGIDLADVFYL